VYRPNKILELAKLGIRDLPFSNAVLLCSACTQCTKGCPQGVRVHEVMHALKDMAVREGKAQDFLSNGFLETLSSLGNEMPFPASYSWICLCPSDKKDGTDSFDGLATDVLRRFVKNEGSLKARSAAAGKNDVAVIGSGPAGLTAAWELARAGMSVTVFESLPEPGGMLRAGIPEYRLPKEVVAQEIENIKALGVEIRTGTAVDQELFKTLREKYKAIFIATGAPANRKLRIEGESLENVVPVLDMLRRYNLDGSVKVGKNVVIVGGGNVAIDAARTAVRCGAETVKLFCLEARNEMPSHEWEIREAISEGVDVNPSWGPAKILGDGNRVTGVEFIRCKSVFDDNKRFNPVFDEKTKQVAQADMVIPAIGQSPDLSFLGNLVETVRGAVSVDPRTMQTSIPGIFAGGDSVSGTASLIEAIVAGRTAAASVIRYLESLK
jgi:NADPH-dependent glutamate synthase beta subunit-like oxidoreductase